MFELSPASRLLPLILVAGCSAKGDFPSLAPRAIELAGAAQPVPAPPLAPSDPARVARFNASVSKAQAGVTAFNAALAKARTAVSASDGARGSERWIAGQMAVSQLERTRAPVQSALAELDQDKRLLLSAPPSADREALETALSRVEAVNTAQQSATRALLDALNPR